MMKRSEFFIVFKEFHYLILTQNNIRIKILRSDKRGEYVNNSFEEFTKERGTIHQTYRGIP